MDRRQEQVSKHLFPFVPLSVSGAPDAGKVCVTGPGIEPGILARYQSRFIVETRGAGAGQLTCIILPKNQNYHNHFNHFSFKIFTEYSFVREISGK